MTRDEVRELADEVLMPILGPVGFMSSQVEEREDWTGEDALYVSVHFAPGFDLAPGGVYGDAIVTMRDALEQHGERRFPYLLWSFPDEPEENAPEDTEANDARPA